MSPDFLSDLAKIGIPSLVALAGTASAVTIARFANTHALALERQRHGFTLARDQETRRAEVLKAAAIEVTKLHHYLVAYGSVLFAKEETLACNEDWPEAEEELERDAHRELLAAFHVHLQTKAYILLLADNDLTRKHDDYLIGASAVLHYEAEGTSEGVALLNELIESNRRIHLILMDTVSQLYLPIHQ